MDTFWSIEISTMSNALTNAKKILKTSREVRLKVRFVSWGPMPKWEYCGCEVSIDVVLDLRRGVRNIKLHTQFRTLRHMRFYFGNFYKASSMIALVNLALKTYEMGCKGVCKLLET